MLFFTLKNVIIRIENRGGILDLIISFFRDFLSGPVYIVVVIISVIGIIGCIGYLAEASLKQKELERRQNAMYAKVHFLPVDESSATSIASNVQTVISSAQPATLGSATATNLAQSEIGGNADVVTTPYNSPSSPMTSGTKQENSTFHGQEQ